MALELLFKLQVCSHFFCVAAKSAHFVAMAMVLLAERVYDLLQTDSAIRRTTSFILESPASQNQNDVDISQFRVIEQHACVAE